MKLIFCILPVFFLAAICKFGVNSGKIRKRTLTKAFIHETQVPFLISKLPFECSFSLFLRHSYPEHMNGAITTPLTITIIGAVSIRDIYGRFVERPLLLSKLTCSITLTHYTPMSDADLVAHPMGSTRFTHALEYILKRVVVGLAFSLYSNRLHNYIVLWKDPRDMVWNDVIHNYKKSYPFIMMKASINLIGLYVRENSQLINVCVLKSNTLPLWINFKCAETHLITHELVESLTERTLTVYSELEHLKTHQTQNVREIESPFETNDYIWYFLKVLTLKANVTFSSSGYIEGIQYKVATIGDWRYYRSAASSYHAEFVLLSVDSLKFLTCYRKPQLSFRMYVDSFDAKTWLALLITVIFLSVFLSVVSSKLNLATSSGVTLYIASLICDDAASVPSKLQEKDFFKFSTSGWLLAVVILIPLYISFVSSALTSVETDGEINRFSELTCPSCLSTPESSLVKKSVYPNHIASAHIESFFKVYRFWREMNMEYMGQTSWWFPRETNKMKTRYNESLYNQGCFRLLSLPREELESVVNPFEFQHPIHFSSVQRTNSYFTTAFPQNYIKPRWGSWDYYYYGNSEVSHHVYLHLSRIANFLSPVSIRNPTIEHSELVKLAANFSLASAVESDIVQCKKSVLIGFENEIAFEKDYLTTNYHRRKFYTSEESLYDFRNAWVFIGFLKSKVPFYFKQLVSTGIFSMARSFSEFKVHLKRPIATRKISNVFQAVEQVSPLTIQGSIHTVFILYLATVIFDILVFMLEKTKQLLKTQKELTSGKGHVVILRLSKGVWVFVKTPMDLATKTLRRPEINILANKNITLILRGIMNLLKGFLSRFTKHKYRL